MEAKVNTSCLLVQLWQKLQLDSQNKFHPELSENRTVWKSNNQGFKEATFIQMDRRGGGTGRGLERWKDTERHGNTNQAVPYPRVVDKN